MTATEEHKKTEMLQCVCAEEEGIQFKNSCSVLKYTAVERATAGRELHRLHSVWYVCCGGTGDGRQRKTK